MSAQDPRKPIRLPGQGWGRKIADELKLVYRLLRDPRVNPLLKLLPFFSIIYLVIPFDIPGPFDDLAVTWLLMVFFIEFSPPHVVAEHREVIESQITLNWKDDDDSTDRS